jgi:hypothetical protein
MQETASINDGKIKVGGIKLSPELVQFNISGRQPAVGSAIPFLRQIAENRINLTCLSFSNSGAAFRGSFCVITSDSTYVRKLVELESAAGYHVEIVAPVGTITIFPHQRSFTLLGHVIGRLRSAGIPIHAVCTSLSSFTINTDFRILDSAVQELLNLLDLPCNHAPFRSESDPAAIKQ